MVKTCYIMLLIFLQFTIITHYPQTALYVFLISQFINEYRVVSSFFAYLSLLHISLRPPPEIADWQFLLFSYSTIHSLLMITSQYKWTKAVLLTLTEKVSRLKLAYRLPNKSPLTVQKKLQSIIEQFGIKSITFDNWIEFMYHYKLGIATYFCHPYHSREKGQVEYTNKLYRIFIKKWTDLSNYTQENIDLFTSNLNNRPMVCLDYETPSKIFHSFLPSVAFAPIM
jgi:hypothetical protein